jgi:ketosteroid isomerase-like protein
MAKRLVPSRSDTLETIERFNEAFNRHDVDAVMALMTEDVVFENTSPAPDGARYEGQAAVRAAWETLFAASPQARFATEETIALGDRCVVRWRYAWGDGHVRGVDVFRVRDGKVAEKLSYVKG